MYVCVYVMTYDVYIPCMNTYTHTYVLSYIHTYIHTYIQTRDT